MMRKYLVVFLLIAALLVLTAGASAQATAAAADPVQAAIQWLHSKQAADGSFGTTNSKGVYTPSAAITADIVYALALAGEDPGGVAWTPNGQSAVDALAKLAPAYVGTDAGQAGKVARAVATAGKNPRSFGGMDLIAVIESAYDENTGRYHPDFLFRHTLAIEALQRAKLPVPQAAYEALRKAQLSDGSWFWTFNGTKGEVDTTGRVLEVLGQAPSGTCDIGFMAAARYLAHAQRPNGAWAVEPLPSTSLPNGNSSGLAVGGLRAIARDPNAEPFVKGETSGLQALLAFQEASGAFVYIAEPGKEEIRLTATTDALLGLLQTLGQPATSGCQAVYLPMVLVQ